jgi:hypothetical protein
LDWLSSVICASLLLASAAVAENVSNPAVRPVDSGKFVKTHPESLTFGPQPVGTPAPSKVVTLTNTGSSTITIADIVTTGIDFSQVDNCNQSLAAGATCTITVTFKPAIEGERMATLQIDDSDPMSPQTVVLTGTGR